MFFDPLYLLFILPGLGLALIAQGILWWAYNNFSRISAGSGMTGMEAAEVLNRKENFGVSFITTPGKLNDYFDPTKDVVNLSQDNATNGSVANIAVVAHEFGHVQQKQQAMSLFRLRTFIAPAVQFGSGVGYFLIILGLLLSFTRLAEIGLILFSLVFVFSLITLPIELDASRRGMALIKKHNLIAKNHLGGARWVLAGAALTYVAALVQSLGQLLYFFLLVNGRRD